MKNINNIVSILVFGIVAVVISLSSCGKEKPPKAEITVTNTDGDRLEGATVILKCIPLEQVKCNVGDTQTTNASGESLHDFKNPAVLRVEATYTLNDSVTLFGDKFVKLEMDKVTKETVVLNKIL
jgi:hypothetical protein